MPDERLGLTPAEAEALRLVDRTRSTGEIAAILDRSIHTVDAQIKSARRRLGGIDRFRAADMLRHAEGHQIEVNPNKVIETDGLTSEELVVEAPLEGGGVDAAPGEVDATYLGPPNSRRPTSTVASRDTDQVSFHRTLMRIVVTAAAIALLLLAAPQLAKGAQALAERLLAGSTGAAAVRK